MLFINIFLWVIRSTVKHYKVWHHCELGQKSVARWSWRSGSWDGDGGEERHLVSWQVLRLGINKRGQGLWMSEWKVRQYDPVVSRLLFCPISDHYRFHL